MPSPAQYRKLIGRLRLDALDKPRLYRRKALLVSMLGHGLVLGLFLAGAALAALGLTREDHLLGILLVAAGLILPIVMLHALHVELPTPAGQALSPDSVPKLWGLLEKLRAKLHAPRIDEVIVDEQCAVRIEHFPRWIWFGPSRHVLVLGLPWLLSLSPKQAAAGIAHEYARFSAHGGWRYAWLTRCRGFWPRYIEAQPGFVDAFPQRLLARYANYMSAYTLPMANDLAIRADAAAARCVGAERAAQAIVRARVMERWLNDFFWPDFMRMADDLPEPDRLPFHSMTAAMRAADRSVSLRRCYQEEIQRKRQLEDADPAIADRLRNLSQKPELTGMPETNAAEHLLGTHLPVLTQALDLAWRQAEQPFWRKRHEAVQSARLWLQNFATQEIDQLNLETLTQYAHALLTVGERNKAMPLLRRAAEHPQGTAETAWSLVNIMTEHDEIEALPYLDLVIQRDALRAMEAAEMALSIAERHGRRDRVGHYRRCVEQLAAA